MELKLEDLAYQREAIDAVVRLFEGQPRNSFDMACHEGVRSNVLSLSSKQVRENLSAVVDDNGIDEETACLGGIVDFCVEMETGTGKGEYTDNERSMRTNKELFDLILKKKELLSLDNPVEFIFSHSALGVGWDNPNVKVYRETTHQRN